ncbi:MAG: SGNH/GDSL hydrolase family protein [Lentisphaeria bacterium]|nr:SGNH/GDSL hydrolase family protein [Lentisphaeria bacterium]
MKKSFLAVCSAALLLTACSTSGTNCPAKADSCTKVKVLPAQHRMNIPPVIYAVPGVESNIYFSNIFLCINSANYAFDVECTKGRNDTKRWRFMPTAKDVGEYPLTVTVMDENGVVAVGKTVVKVAPQNAGKGEKVSVILIGDSLTNASIYPQRLYDLMKKPGNPELTMIGSHAGSARKPLPGGMAHEGFSGWAWSTFLSRYKDEAEFKTPRQKFEAKSKFLTKKDGKVVPDIKLYLDKYANGKKPDYITIQLGVNDIFFAKDDTLPQFIAKIESNMVRMVNLFREALPDTVIGIGLVTPGAWQDGFGHSYANGQTAWQYRKNHFALNKRMMEKIAAWNDPKIIMIPTNVNLDTENNFPQKKEPVNNGNNSRIARQNNGVHPSPAGYKQIGDTFYAWLKYQLSLRKK